MPAIASLEELTAVQAALAKLEAAHPQAYAEAAELFRRFRGIGYRNIARLLLKEATPEKLKGAP